MVAAIFHIINHAAFKASLFMAAGIIDHETGTRDIRRLSGLNRSMPFTARLALVAAAAMAGVPLLNGFLSKEMFFAEALSAQASIALLIDVLPLAAMVASAFSVAYSLRFIHGAFFGPDPVGLPRTPHEPPAWMRFPVEILVLACIVVGVLPAATVGPFLDMAVRFRPGRGHARVQPRGLARLQPAAADEPDRAGRRARALPRTPAPPAEGHRRRRR